MARAIDRPLRAGTTSRLNDLERRVARHYGERIFDLEMRRLPEECPVELAITARAIERYIPKGSEVAEVGVGGGHYSELLARRGCFLHLVDITPGFLAAVALRIEKAGLEKQVRGVFEASATNLSTLADGSLDAVLLLGPLYHLQSSGDRRRAVREASRLLREGGVILAAGVNRLTYLRDLFRGKPDEALGRRKFHARYLRDGNLTPGYAPPIGFAHMSSAQEFRRLLGARFRELLLTGVESFASPFQGLFHGLGPRVREAWLDLIEQTGITPEGLGLSDHFLFVGRK